MSDESEMATGAEPRRLTVPGCDDPGVRVVRSLDQVRELLHRLRSAPDAIVIGSGFIGCEIATSLRRRGHGVTLVSDEPAPNARRLGSEAGTELARWLADESMRTALPDLLAAGDVCRAFNAAAGRRLRVEHWGDALTQGEIAGSTAAGVPASWDSVPGFWSTIGTRTLKYAAWGDGYDEVAFERRPDEGFTAHYLRDGRLVGVLAHQADDVYERGQQLIAAGASWR